MLKSRIPIEKYLGLSLGVCFNHPDLNTESPSSCIFGLKHGEAEMLFPFIPLLY